MLKVLNGGIQTLVQDWAGRVGRLDEGIAPSGAMDHFAIRAANLIVGNPLNEAALEISGGLFSAEAKVDTVIAVTGANLNPSLNGQPIPLWEALSVKKGDMFTSGNIGANSLGLREYLAIAGGINVPPYLGSKSTTTYGGFGGYEGRSLKEGDGAPDYFSEEGMELFFTAEFHAQVFSDRAGIRLTGPELGWAKEREVEGRHPSTLMSEHGYSVPGALNISGDTPILLPREGPTMGGYICALTVIYADQWMLGQIVPGRDTVKFIYCTPDEANKIRKEQEEVFQENSITC